MDLTVGRTDGPTVDSTTGTATSAKNRSRCKRRIHCIS